MRCPISVAAFGPIAAALSCQLGVPRDCHVIRPSGPGSYSNPNVVYPWPSYEVVSVSVMTDIDSVECERVALSAGQA